MKVRYLLYILLILPFLSGCSDEDDVLGIFTKHPWRLTDVFEKGKPKHPTTSTLLWSSERDYNAYIKALENPDNFIVDFEGIEGDGNVYGNINGYATSSSISGEWKVIKNSREMSNKVSSRDNGTGKILIEALNNAHSYDGDYNNLRIHFKKNNQEFFLLFHNPNK